MNGPRSVRDLRRAAEAAVRGQRDGTAGRILAAGLMLFARRGYHGTSIRDIGHELEPQAAILYVTSRRRSTFWPSSCASATSRTTRCCFRALVASRAGRRSTQLESLVRAHVWLHAEYAMLTMRGDERAARALARAGGAVAGAARSSRRRCFATSLASRRRRGRLRDAVHPWVHGRGHRRHGAARRRLAIARTSARRRSRWPSVHAELACADAGGRRCKADHCPRR